MESRAMRRQQRDGAGEERPEGPKQLLMQRGRALAGAAIRVQIPHSSQGGTVKTYEDGLRFTLIEKETQSFFFSRVFKTSVSLTGMSL